MNRDKNRSSLDTLIPERDWRFPSSIARYELCIKTGCKRRLA